MKDLAGGSIPAEADANRVARAVLGLRENPRRFAHYGEQ
jgi:hypothetical protein